MDSPKQRAKRDVFVTTVRVWHITILLLVIGALVAVILEKIETKYLSPPSSSQINRPEK